MIYRGPHALIGSLCFVVCFVGDVIASGALYAKAWRVVFYNPKRCDSGELVIEGLISDDVLWPLRPDLVLYEEAKLLSQRGG